MGVRRQGMEYRSEHLWGDLPVVHVSIGGRQADGRYRLGRARGVIALGDVAIGLVAVGGVAIGLVGVGGVAIGLLALGGVAVGFVAVGAVSVGLLAVGAVALGLTAVGTLKAALVGGVSRRGNRTRRRTKWDQSATPADIPANDRERRRFELGPLTVSRAGR